MPTNKAQFFKKFSLGFAFILCMFLAVSCATAPPQSNKAAYAAYKEANDPLEPFNRNIFKFNIFFDKYILKPVTWLYIQVTPRFARKGVNNFLQNVGEGVVLANDIFQGRWIFAKSSFIRITLNTFLGLFGTLDLANKVGYTYHSNDFGLTLKTYGMGDGYYIMLPLLGPSTLRDGPARLVDVLFSPLFYLHTRHWQETVAISGGYMIAQGIVFRSNNYEMINQVERSSLDLYLTMRSFYRQSRQGAFQKLNIRPSSGPVTTDTSFGVEEDQEI